MRETILVPIDQIEANRYQPRLQFDEKALQELSDSILENGLIQPITVRKVEDHYEIIAGERRYKACVKAGYKEVPCYVLTPNENQAAQMALVENVQRENLTAVEEAKAYVQIMRQANLTQEGVAQKIGKSQSSVANKIRLLNLPQEIQDGVITKQITERHARALLSLENEDQIETFHTIVEQKLNVRQAEALIETVWEKKQGKEPRKKKQVTKGFTRSIQIGINSVNQCIEMIKKTGIQVETETQETDKDVRIIIKFPK